MAGITLAQAQAQLDAWLAASLATATGQAYEIAGRRLTRANAAEITAITNQTVNSYKRLVPGFEAPVHISWARNNRSGLIRVPVAKRDSEQVQAIIDQPRGWVA